MTHSIVFEHFDMTSAIQKRTVCSSSITRGSLSPAKSRKLLSASHTGLASVHERSRQSHYDRQLTIVDIIDSCDEANMTCTMNFEAINLSFGQRGARMRLNWLCIKQTIESRDGMEISGRTFTINPQIWRTWIARGWDMQSIFPADFSLVVWWQRLSITVIMPNDGVYICDSLMYWIPSSTKLSGRFCGGWHVAFINHSNLYCTVYIYVCRTRQWSY